MLAQKNCADSSRQVLVAKGDSCLSQFNYAHAVAYFKAANDMQPSNLLRRKIAGCYSHLGLYRDGISMLRGIQRDSLSAVDMHDIFFAYKALNENDSLEYFGNLTLRHNPYDADVAVSLASHLISSDHPDDAIDVCEAYLQLDSTNVLVKKQLGYALYLLAEYGETVDIYRELDEKGDHNFDTQFVLGMAYEQIDHAEDALRHLEKAYYASPTPPKTLIQHLAMLCERLGLTKEGIRYTEEAIAMNMPDSALITALYKNLGALYFKTNDFNEAARCFEKCLNYEKTNPVTLYNIAQMYYYGTEHKQADKYFRLFLNHTSLLKDNEETRKMIKEAKEKMRLSR